MIGLNGFDPILAVLGPNDRVAFCEDDTLDASGYSADLPTTGVVQPSSSSAQAVFHNSGSGFSDVSLVVGGFNAEDSGEFLVILEGMAYTNLDGQGDPFALEITPGMIAIQSD